MPMTREASRIADRIQAYRQVKANGTVVPFVGAVDRMSDLDCLVSMTRNKAKKQLELYGIPYSVTLERLESRQDGHSLLQTGTGGHARHVQIALAGDSRMLLESTPATESLSIEDKEQLELFFAGLKCRKSTRVSVQRVLIKYYSYSDLCTYACDKEKKLVTNFIESKALAPLHRVLALKDAYDMLQQYIA
jgi:hypothetical protein